jgi:hypothetical protein
MAGVSGDIPQPSFELSRLVKMNIQRPILRLVLVLLTIPHDK